MGSTPVILYSVFSLASLFAQCSEQNFKFYAATRFITRFWVLSTGQFTFFRVEQVNRWGFWIRSQGSHYFCWLINYRTFLGIEGPVVNFQCWKSVSPLAPIIYHLLLNMDICVSNILARDDNLIQNSLFFPLSDPGGLISSLQQLSLITELIGTWKSTHNSSLCAVNYCKTMTAVSSMKGPKNTFQIPHPATVFHPIPPSRRSKHLHPDLAWLNPSRYISPSYFDRWK